MILMGQIDSYLSKIGSKLTQTHDIEIFFKEEHDELVKNKNDKNSKNNFLILLIQVNLCCHF